MALTEAFVQQDQIQREVYLDDSHIYPIERSLVLTRSRRVTAALIAKYVNRASYLFTSARAFHIRLSYRNSYSVRNFLYNFLTLVFDISFSIFPAGEDGFGQMMYRSLERSPQDPRDGIFLYRSE